ncbi:hypothetical protein GG344DRAFT_83739 [Lentinula edodes]|nr:hypothetical protein GG344DRAFT_83739 [Lentinula edodes]
MIEPLWMYRVRLEDSVPPLVEMKGVVNPEWSSMHTGDSSIHEDLAIPKYITLDMQFTLLTVLVLVLIAHSVPVPALSSSALDPTSPSPGEGVGESKGDTEGGLQKSEGAVADQVGRLHNWRITLLGLATLGGGLFIGLSAGLASTCLAASAGAAVITTGNVLTGAGIMGKATFSLTHFPSSTSTARGAFQ